MRAESSHSQSCISAAAPASHPRERRAVERALAGWMRLAAGECPPAAEVAALIARLRPADLPALDQPMVERLAILAEVAAETREPVAFDGWMEAGASGPQLVRAALLPAVASDGTIAVAFLLGAALRADFTSPPAAAR